MTGKVQKIREWVKARLDENTSKQSLPQFYGMMEEDARFLDFLDSLQEEPVSEDLEEAAKHYLYGNILYDDVYVGNPTDEDCIEMFKAGAKWQEKRDQSTIELAEDHAMLAGMEKMKEEMIAKAVEVTVHVDAGNYPYIPQIELYDYDKNVPLAKEGDKYKVIFIKED